MKYLLSVLVIFAIQSKLLSQDCECWEQTFKAADHEYSKAVLRLEQAFISKGYLKSNKPKAYTELLDQIIDRNEYFLFGIDYDTLLLNDYSRCFLVNSCEESIYEKIQLFVGRLSQYNDITPELAYGDFKNTFDKDDFNRAQVKHFFLTFYCTIFLQSVMSLDIPEDDLKLYSLETEARKIIKIYVSAEDSIFIDGGPIKLEEVRGFLKQRITDEYDSAVVTVNIEKLGKRKAYRTQLSIQINRNASYGIFTKVIEDASVVFNDFRNEVALKEFGVTHDEMSEERHKYRDELKIMQILVPARIELID